jgi:hypothetical protein
LRRNNVGNRGNCATAVAIRIEAIHPFKRLDFSA